MTTRTGEEKIMHIRELTSDEQDNVNGAVWAIAIAVALVVFEEEINGFKDGLYEGFTNGK